jgi:NTP pyrophosphatase (non-canonical NTP hydrolase)
MKMNDLSKYAPIEAELKRAKKLHPKYPKGMFKRLAIMQEEAGEVTKAVYNNHYEGGSIDDIREELTQTAATCMRFLEALDAENTQILKKVGNYWVDSNENKWACKAYSEEQALKNSKNLTNCWNCTNCRDCTNCECCEGCIDCENCIICTACEGCIGCIKCRSCTQCGDCADCKSCIRCADCKECAYCLSCNNLSRTTAYTNNDSEYQS